MRVPRSSQYLRIALSLSLLYLSPEVWAIEAETNQPITQPVKISLAECVETGKRRSLQVLQATQNELRTQASWQEAKSNKLPQLIGNLQISQTNNLATQLQDANSFYVTLQQIAYPFSPIWRQAEQRSVDYQASHVGKIETEQDVELLIKQYYFDILMNLDILKNLADVESLLIRLSETVIPKYTVGRAPSFDIAQVKTTLASLHAQRTVTEAQVRAQKSRLSQLLGLPPDGALELQPIQTIPSLADYFAEKAPGSRPLELGDFGLNPSFQRLQLQVKSADLGVGIAGAARLPTLVAAFETDYSGATLSDLSSGWTFAVGLQFPIFTWGKIGAQVRQQQISVDLQQTQLDLLKQKTNSDWIQATQLAKATLENEQKFKLLIPEVHRVSILSIERYKSRATSILEVASAVNLWLNTFSNERTAYYTYLGTLAQMERLNGQSQRVKYE